MATEAGTFESRQRALRLAMAREGLPALVLFGQPSYNGLGPNAHGYIRYLTGWTSRLDPSLLVIPTAGPPVLVVAMAIDSLALADSLPWIERCEVRPVEGYGRLARELLGQIGARRAGVVGQSVMPQPIYRDLVAGPEAPELVPAEHLIEALRRIKDETEIASHRRAARASDAMLAALVEHLRGYRGPAWKLMVEMEHAGRSLGAEQAFCWLAVGQRVHHPRWHLRELAREVRDGDQALVSTYVSHDGYWAQGMRMGSVGPPSKEYSRLHQVVLEQHRAAVARIRAGAAAFGIQAEAERVAREMLPGAMSYPAAFRYAHFLGLDYAEPPTVEAFPPRAGGAQGDSAPAAGVALQPGMVLEVHPNIGAEGVGFAVVGDVYLVREEGPERLTQFPQELFVV